MAASADSNSLLPDRLSSMHFMRALSLSAAFTIFFSLSFSFLPIAAAMLPKGVAGYAGAVGFVIYYLFPNFIFYFQDFKMFGLVFFMLLIYSLSLSFIFLFIAVGRLETMDYSKNSDV